MLTSTVVAYYLGFSTYNVILHFTDLVINELPLLNKEDMTRLIPLGSKNISCFIYQDIFFIT